MPTWWIAVPEGFQTGLETQASSLVSTLWNWLPIILIATLAIPVIVSFFRFITRYVRGNLRVRG